MHAHPLEARLAHVEGAFQQVNERLNSLERRFDSLEHLVALRFDQVDRKFTWLTGIVVATWITTMLTVLFRH
jgi:tetrahydromethanopterin S-methyltransferase subunit G